MPIYEYRCKQCHHEFEILELSRTETLPQCKNCGGETEKQFSSFAMTVSTGRQEIPASCQGCPTPNACGFE